MAIDEVYSLEEQAFGLEVAGTEERLPDEYWVNDCDFFGPVGYEATWNDPNSEPISQFLQSRLHTLPDVVALDIAGGSNGVALEELVTAGVVDRGLFTNYQNRWEQPLGTTLEQVTGNLALQATWDSIFDWQQRNAPEGFSLILHRPHGALQRMPYSFYERAVHALLDMTSPGGVALLQIPLAIRSGSSTAVKNQMCEKINERADVESVALRDGILPSVTICKVRSTLV